MLRDERFQKILEMLKENVIISVSEISKSLNVTEMTIRRDLKILEEGDQLIRVHGGAKRKGEDTFKELSHDEKQQMHVEEKKSIAKIAAGLIEENDTVFLGPGTTNEMIYDYLQVNYAKIITNSITVFSKFVDDKRFEMILVGGKLRSRTGAFVGNFANDMLKKIRVKKAFIGTNGIYGENITTFNEDEGVAQSIILDNAEEKYILADSSKIGKTDFFVFYNLNHITAIITDSKINTKSNEEYRKITKIIFK
ncbi:MAG: DeoR/GlpR transcriptional regulator [Clostridiaceae bacterium]|nr:DeoR/GlpR transcriptional regulator [Clostridiaceae bacterium]